jgi:hypothetical protein
LDDLVDEHVLDPDIIVFGPIKSTDPPHCPDDEKPRISVFIDPGGTAVSSSSHARLCSRVQRSILLANDGRWQMTAGWLKYRDIKIDECLSLPPIWPQRYFKIRRPDFSTAAGNSALIVVTKALPRSQRCLRPA